MKCIEFGKKDFETKHVAVNGERDATYPSYSKYVEPAWPATSTALMRNDTST
jgi:hypothetical protein